MKKLIAIVLAVLTVLSFSTVAFAADTTTLTTTVPDATYTLNIPADQEITFGVTRTDIGYVTVTNSANFAAGKNLKVTVTYDAFKADGISTTIPYTLEKPYKTMLTTGGTKENFETLSSGGYLLFLGLTSGEVKDGYVIDTGSILTETDYKTLNISVNSTDWGKALAGDYSSTITFTAEVVAEV